MPNPEPQPDRAAHAVARSHVPFGVIVAIACVAQFMVVLDSSIVNVALPSMRTALGLSATAQQWVVDGYLIAFGGLLLLAARAGDLFGRRRVLQAGLVVFTLASLVGGLAQDGAVLLASRITQGVGAAALAPSSLSLIVAGHSDPRRRTRALTWWGVAASSAGATGMVLGGVLTAELDWRWVFFVNIPIGLVLLIATVVFLLPSPAADRRPALDLPGALTVTSGVAALVYGISVAPSDGWGSARVIVPLVAAAVLLTGFVLLERRANAPLVPLSLFAHPDLRTANVLMLCLGVVITAPLFFLSLYLQQVLGESALRAGLSLLPMAVVLSGGVLVSRRLLPVVGPRWLILAGGLTSAAGLVWLAHLPTHSAYAGHLLIPTLLAGVGMSVMVLPITGAATAGVDPRDAGVASGLANMGRQVGGALGLAALATLAASATSHSTTHGAAAVVHGYDTALFAVAGVSALAALLGRLLKTGPAARPAVAPASATGAKTLTR